MNFNFGTELIDFIPYFDTSINMVSIYNTGILLRFSFIWTKQQESFITKKKAFFLMTK